jgi:shikimate 5-dehydrogenase
MSSPSVKRKRDDDGSTGTGTEAGALKEKANTDAAATTPLSVVVFGGGTFGTAMGTLLARNKHNVTLVMRTKARAASVNDSHRNADYLSTFELPPTLTAVSDDDEPSVAASLAAADLIVHAIPVQHSPAYLRAKKHLIPDSVPIVSLSKGIFLADLSTWCGRSFQVHCKACILTCRVLCSRHLCLRAFATPP